VKTRNIEEIKENITMILKRHGVRKAALFGSCARGDMKEDSDIDILVDIDKDLSLLDFVSIKLDLEEALGRKVDLVEYNAIKPRLRDKIFNDQVTIL